MRDSLYLAWQYLLHHRIKSLILILSVAMIVFLPTGLKLVVEQGGEALRQRAEQTPLLVGAKGSSLELTLNALYFSEESPEPIAYSESERVVESGLADAIPMYIRFQSAGFAIVGTSIDYFSFRTSRFAEGRQFATIGECVIGSAVADELDLSVGDKVISSPESVFDLAGVYPLKMKVVGILESSGNADDRAIFTDLKTTWVIQGLAHGHMDMESSEAASSILKKEEGKIVANASVKTYNEITQKNIHSFHFHGSVADFPISSVIAIPTNAKSATLLRGRYLEKDGLVQIVQASEVMEDLLETIASVQVFVLIGLGVAGISACMTMVLVFLLSAQLRQREMLTMKLIGAESGKVAILLSLEIGSILILGSILAILLSVIVAVYGPQIIQSLIL